MLRVGLQLLGVDYHQWRALVKTAIRKDFRQSTMSTTLSHGRTGKRIFLSLLFFYLLVGFLFVPVIVSSASGFFSATLLITYTMFMIGGLILVEYNTVVVSLDDFLVLGYRPVSSRTFFFVRLTNILFYVLTFSMLLSLPAIAAFLFANGFQPLTGVAAFVSVFLANTAMSLNMVLFYTYILKKINARRVKNLLAILQVGMAFFIYSSFFVIPNLLENSKFYTAILERAVWILFLPSTWFSSYLPILTGEAVAMDYLLASLSLLMLLSSGYFAVSRLSMHYAESLSEVTETTAGKKQLPRRFMKPFLLFAHAHEERVVSKLIRNQFLYDNKFKMAVLGILPLTIFYLFVGVEKGPLPNPFESYDFAMGRSGLLYLLVFLFPMMLRTYVTQSDDYHASWIFYTTPSDVCRLILSEKNFLMIYFVLPFLFILGVIFYHYFQNLLHVLLHILVLGLLAHFFLQLAFLYSPDLPFSRPNVKGSRTRNMAIFIVIIPFIIYLFLPLIFKFVYSNPASFLTFAITILTVSLVLESLIQVRVKLYMKHFEFPG